MTEWIVSAMIILGSLFMLVAALGVIRLHDVYMRMHAITKASSLGIVFYLLAVVISCFSWNTLIASVLVMVFIVATAPVASHMIARAAHMMGIPMSKGYVMDHLKRDMEKQKKEPDNAGVSGK
jgi:multicomponent Na+:H+ antiporter subunit G